MIPYKMIYLLDQYACTLLYINFVGLYIIRNRSLCTKFIIYAMILYGDQIVRRSFFMAPVGESSQSASRSEKGSLKDVAHLKLLNLHTYRFFSLIKIFHGIEIYGGNEACL